MLLVIQIEWIHRLFCKKQSAILYGWVESGLSVFCLGQHIWKLQCDEKASWEGKRRTKTTAKGITKIKKRGNLLLWCSSKEQICFISSFLMWLFFFPPGFNTFTKQGSCWSAEPKCISVIFQLSDKLYSHFWLAKTSGEAALLQHTLTDVECFLKTEKRLQPSLSRLLPSRSLGIRSRRLYKQED